MRENKTCQIHVRVTSQQKEELKKTAAKAGITITELISVRLKDMPIKDYQKENEFLLKINALTQDLGYIGNNINQATVAIHQLKNAGAFNDGELGEFNDLMRQYLKSRSELSENLQKLFFN